MFACLSLPHLAKTATSNQLLDFYVFVRNCELLPRASVANCEHIPRPPVPFVRWRRVVR